MGKVCALISLHAGGGWLGHVFFLVSNPITGQELRTNSLVEVEEFCKKQNLYFDRHTMINDVFPELTYDLKKGWLVPKPKIDESHPISSANQFLSKLNEFLNF